MASRNHSQWGLSTILPTPIVTPPRPFATCNPSRSAVDGDAPRPPQNSIRFPSPAGVCLIPPDLELKNLAFALEEPCPEPAHFFRWQHEARQPEHWTVVVSRVCAAHVGANMSEFVKICEIRHTRRSSRNTKTRAGARASERGQYKIAPHNLRYIRHLDDIKSVDRADRSIWAVVDCTYSGNRSGNASPSWHPRDAQHRRLAAAIT